MIVYSQTVQKRGAAVIAARKLSSAMSAAKAACDHMKSIWHGTPEGQYVSMGVFSDGSYNTPEGVMFSFPVTIKDKKWSIVMVRNKNIVLIGWGINDIHYISRVEFALGHLLITSALGYSDYHLIRFLEKHN